MADGANIVYNKQAGTGLAVDLNKFSGQLLGTYAAVLEKKETERLERKDKFVKDIASLDANGWDKDNPFLLGEIKRLQGEWMKDMIDQDGELSVESLAKRERDKHEFATQVALSKIDEKKAAEQIKASAKYYDYDPKEMKAFMKWMDGELGKRGPMPIVHEIFETDSAGYYESKGYKIKTTKNKYPSKDGSKSIQTTSYDYGGGRTREEFVLGLKGEAQKFYNIHHKEGARFTRNEKALAAQADRDIASKMGGRIPGEENYEEDWVDAYTNLSLTELEQEAGSIGTEVVDKGRKSGFEYRGNRAINDSATVIHNPEDGSFSFLSARSADGTIRQADFTVKDKQGKSIALVGSLTNVLPKPGGIYDISVRAKGSEEGLTRLEEAGYTVDRTGVSGDLSTGGFNAVDDFMSQDSDKPIKPSIRDYVNITFTLRGDQLGTVDGLISGSIKELDKHYNGSSNARLRPNTPPKDGGYGIAVGTKDGGYTYMGGDPNDANSWKKDK